MAMTSVPNVVRFPRSKKRGAKVKRGPCADLIQMPGAMPSGDDLFKLWRWTFEGFACWHCEDSSLPTSGAERQRLEQELAQHPWRDEYQLPEKRAIVREQIVCFSEAIDTRKRVKSWIRLLGATEVDLNHPERALEFLYQHFRALPDKGAGHD